MRLLHLALGGCLTSPPVPFGLTEDTGGHIAYVMGAAATQADWPGVERVDIATRLFDEPELGAAFAVPLEAVRPRLNILRIATSNRRYLSKAALAADLPAFTAALIARMRREGLRYDLVHAHFADAAGVAASLRQAFGTPFLYHAHSLGLDKLAGEPAGLALRARIAAEDAAIAGADAIIASSHDEAWRQLPAYPSARPARILRAAPGIDRAAGGSPLRRAEALIAPFLRQPGRPLIVAVARPVERKNLVGLIEIYAGSPTLRARADLVILAGLRHDIASAEPEQAGVLRGLLAAIDRHDLYGHVAIPKRHLREDVFALYRLAALSGGVFAQPAFCEPYGLTIAEAAAEGLPVVATNRGGARDIVDALGCGVVADPLDRAAFGVAIESLLTNARSWQEASRRGRQAAALQNWMGWAAPVMALAQRVAATAARPAASVLLTCDMDDTLTGSAASARRFAQWRAAHPSVAFAIATGRTRPAAIEVLRAWGLPEPDILITGAGADIGHHLRDGGYADDAAWAEWAAAGWQPDAVAAVLDTVPGLTRQPASEQRPLKLSWFGDAAAAAHGRGRLAAAGLAGQLLHSHGRHLDALAPRAGKGAAMLWCADALGIAHENCLAAGDSGNDSTLLAAAGGAILVANHDADLAHLRQARHVHVARAAYADGVLEGVRRFLPGEVTA